jgi:hypothetical protein
MNYQMEHDMITALRSADPLAAAADDTATEAHLVAARRVLEARMAAQATPPATLAVRRRGWSRKLAIAAAIAVTLPIAAVIVVPDITARLGLAQRYGGAVGTATADGGGTAGLSCGGGSAKAIRPDEADVRLWPTELPPGWRVRQVFARATSGYGWCTQPSLVLAGTLPDGTVVGSVQVTGPARDIRMDNDDKTTPDTVAGLPAGRLMAPNEGGHDPLMHRWIVTDRDRGDWYVTVFGYTLPVARQLLAGVRIAGTDIAWAHVAGPDVRVLHVRTGAPYPLTARGGLDWYVRIDDGTLGDRWLRQGSHVAGVERRQLEIWAGRPGGVSEFATPGSRLLEVGGRPAVLARDGGRDVALYVDVAPGVQAFSNVYGDLPSVAAMLASLTNLDRDDPRLDRLAMKTNTSR